MKEQILRELLQTRDFYGILNRYNLYRYELVKAIREELIKSSMILNTQERSLLQEIFKVEAIMLRLNYDPVVFISDTHYSGYFCEFFKDRWDYLQIVLDFCRRNRIYYLVHGGDIFDGTTLHEERPKNIKFTEDFTDFDYDTRIRQEFNNALNQYPIDIETHQYLLGGNHDKRYKTLKINALEELTRKKATFPLGYEQAFFSVFDCPISLEHGKEDTDEPTYGNLIPHEFTIYGHSHIYDPFKTRQGFFLPTLSDHLCHFNEKGGEPGFVVMYPYLKENVINLEFEHYYFKEDNVMKDKEPFILKLHK